MKKMKKRSISMEKNVRCVRRANGSLNLHIEVPPMEPVEASALPLTEGRKGDLIRLVYMLYELGYFAYDKYRRPTKKEVMSAFLSLFHEDATYWSQTVNSSWEEDKFHDTLKGLNDWLKKQKK